jgi:Bax protein
VTLTIRHAETRSAPLLQAAFDRIGFDLDAVSQGYISVPRVLLASLPPDLDRLEGMDARKTLFVRALLPVILYVNDQIGADRQMLLGIHSKLTRGDTLSAEEVQWVLSLSDAYEQPDADVDALLKKVDVIPPSLALAQAVEESGWGTSRIAREQNALFGQFGQGASGDWDYRIFVSLTDAVASYAHNLNTHRAYREFRQVRAAMRSKQRDIDSAELAGTLHRYSERGDEYVISLRSIMRVNALEAFDSARLNLRSVATIMARN